MYSNPNDCQMPRTLPTYPIQHHHHHHHHHQQRQQQQLLEQQLQVFQHFQAFRQQQVESHPAIERDVAAAYFPHEPIVEIERTDDQQQDSTNISSITNSANLTITSIDSNHRNTNNVIHTPTGGRRAARGKSKRIRTIFTPEQLKRLEQEFSNQMYLVGHDRCFLASSLHLSEAQVKVWFQNRRIKFRKLNPGITVIRAESGSPSTNGDSNSDGETRVSSSYPATSSTSSSASFN